MQGKQAAPAFRNSIAVGVLPMVLGYHPGDIRAVPNDTAVQEALRPFNLEPDDYALESMAGLGGRRTGGRRCGRCSMG